MTGLDEGGRRLAGLILQAAGRGEQDTVDQLVSPLDVDQLRGLVGILAAQVDESMPTGAATGPTAVCDRVTTMAAKMFGVEPEAIMSAQRSRPVSDARAVAMSSARALGLSYPSIAREFGKDHGSVIHAVRRTADRPRLTDAAARITEHVEQRYARQVARPVDNLVQLPARVAQAAQDATAAGAAAHAAAAAFSVPVEAVLGRDRSRSASDARAVAMTAARLRGGTLTGIAEAFGRDHTTVLAATRRIEATPPLHDLAASIAADMPATGTSPSGVDDVEETFTTPVAQCQRQPPPSRAPARSLSVGR